MGSSIGRRQSDKGFDLLFVNERISVRCEVAECKQDHRIVPLRIGPFGLVSAKNPVKRNSLVVVDTRPTVDLVDRGEEPSGSQNRSPVQTLPKSIATFFARLCTPFRNHSNANPFEPLWISSVEYSFNRPSCTRRNNRHISQGRIQSSCIELPVR